MSLPDLVHKAATHALDQLAVAEERGAVDSDWVVCEKLVPRREGLKAVLLLVGSPERIDAAYAALMEDNDADS